MRISMKNARSNHFWGCVLAVVLAAPAWGQSVHIVAGDGTGDFVQLKDAVSAAVDGDVILVRPHTDRYDFTTIDGKSLTIIGEGAVRPGVEDMRVQNLAAGEVVTLRFLDIEGRAEAIIFGPTQYDGLVLNNNVGCVWLEELVIAGADGIANWGGSETGYPGLVIGGSNCVAVVDCQSGGGVGQSSVGGSSHYGGSGGVASASQVALHGSSFVGGKGGPAFIGPPLEGGTGFDSLASTVLASGSSLTGGDTGDVFAAPSLSTARAMSWT